MMEKLRYCIANNAGLQVSVGDPGGATVGDVLSNQPSIVSAWVAPE
jgi:hypothetical protein